MSKRFATGFGYGYDPDKNQDGFHWYPCSGGHAPFFTRQEAHDECQRELSYLGNQLYTQRWVKIFGIVIKLAFTRRAVERSEAAAAWGEATIINALKGNLSNRLETLICRYDDCGVGKVSTDDNEQITCPNCRKDLGLDPLD